MAINRNWKNWKRGIAGFFLTLLVLAAEAAVAQGPPTHIGPTNNKVDVRVDPLLRWNGVAGATGYDWQVYQGTNLIKSGNNIQATSARITLSYGTEYRWRIRARVLPNNNPWSGYWTFTTVGLVPPPHVSPANGATGLPLNVTIQWGGVAGATGFDWQIYKGAALVQSGNNVATNQATYTLEANTTYTWRTRARVAPNNNPWSTPWSFTTLGPTPPAHVSPANNSTVGDPTAVTIQWGGVAGATGYDWQIFDGATVVASGNNIQTTSASATLAPAKRYTWRARARILPNDNPWSSPWAFFTPALTPPQHLSPPDQSTTSEPTSVTIRWGGVEGATGFDWQVHLAGNVVASGNNVATNQATVTLQHATTYQWRIRARVIENNNPWSGFWSFTTAALIPPDHLAPPNHSTTNHPINVTIQWGGAAGATGFDWQIYEGESLVTSGNNVATNQVTRALEPETTYRWRIRARVAPQNNPWSEYWTFTTAALRPPEHRFPPDGSEGLPIRVMLDWDPRDGATHYDLQVRRDGQSEPEIDLNRHPGTETTVTLIGNRKYFWRVRARVAENDNPWSEEWSLETNIPVTGVLATISGDPQLQPLEEEDPSGPEDPGYIGIIPDPVDFGTVIIPTGADASLNGFELDQIEPALGQPDFEYIETTGALRIFKPGPYRMTVRPYYDNGSERVYQPPFSVEFQVAKLRPIIDWPAPSPIVYGTPLSAEELSATARPIEGFTYGGTFSYSYVPPGEVEMVQIEVGDQLPAGTHGILCSFSPSDLSLARPPTFPTGRHLEVTPAPLIIRAPDTIREEGLSLADLRPVYIGLVNGDSPDSIDSAPGLMSDSGLGPDLQPGTYTLEVTGGADPNYTITRESGTLTITSTPDTLEELSLHVRTTDSEREISWTHRPGLVLHQSTDLKNWIPVDGVASDGNQRRYSFTPGDPDLPGRIYFLLRQPNQ